MSVKGRKLSEEHKRKIGLANKGKRKGKSWEEIFGIETASCMKEERQKFMTGRTWEWNDDSKRKISELRKGNMNWMKTAEYRQQRRGIAILNQTGLTVEEWEQLASDRHKYYLEVKRITESQPLHLLDHYETRGHYNNNKDAYHLDHIIPISYGFANNIPANVIGHIDNLKFIHWKDNVTNGSKYEED